MLSLLVLTILVLFLSFLTTLIAGMAASFLQSYPPSTKLHKLEKIRNAAAFVMAAAFAVLVLLIIFGIIVS